MAIGDPRPSAESASFDRTAGPAAAPPPAPAVVGTAARRPRGTLERLAPALLVLLGLLVFVPGLLGEFVWDDLMLIRGNAYVRDPSRLLEALTHDFWHVSTADPVGEQHGLLYYRPVVTLAYALEFQLFGEAPFGYHAVSLLLHLVCVLLAFGWLRRRLGEGPGGTAAALVGAALFAVHASRPESVSWVSGSTDLWMVLFVLSGLWLWDRASSRAAAAGATLCFALAVLSKETAVVVPVLLAADAWLRHGPGRSGWCAARRAALPLLGVSAVFLLRLSFVPLRSAGFAGPGDAAWTVLSTAGHYVRAMVWPWPPSVEASFVLRDAAGHTVHRWWSVGLGLVAVSGFLGLSVAAWRRRALRPWLADAAWFVVPLLPVLNLWPLGLSTLASARNLYLPLLGGAAWLARGLAAAGRRSDALRPAVFGAGGLAVAFFSLVSLYQIHTLRSEDALWTYEHSIAPDNPYAAERLARVRFQQGRYREALEAVRAAWEASSGAETRRVHLVLLGADIAMAATSDADQAKLRSIRTFYERLARGQDARLEIGDGTLELAGGERMARYLAEQPARFLVPRAVAHARTLDLEEARRQLEEVVGRFPASVDGWVQLALVLARESRWAEARRAVESGLAVQPDEARLLQLRRDVDTAERLAASSAAADPATRAMMRAQTLLAFAGFELARRELAPVLAAHPDRPEPVLLRILIDAGDARFDLARRTVEEARARMPAQSELWDEALRRIADEEQAWRSAHGVP
ncbi:MAG: hypothetical protein GYA57_03150 [Myxococcales bacterium]|nr:hypothetical protein [Myxococcales bacterium]